ncbi:MAG: EF-hand domain-containing protein [Planctomycetaceae bacterium]
MKRTPWVFSAALAALVSGNALSHAQDAPADLGALFQKLDKNGDGKLTASEIPEDQARFFERLVRRGDKNSDGELTRDEFDQANKPEERPNVSLNNGPTGEQARAEARQRFEMLDRNKDGKVTLEEVPEQLRDRIKPIFDRSGKTELTFEEFTRQAFGGARPDPAELFKRLDANSDGKLTKAELPAEFKERWAGALERLGKDEITQDEFVQLAQRMMEGRGGQPGEGRPLGNPEEIFSRMDTNGDGKLTINEAPERARQMLEGLFRRAGKEREGSLTKEEFVKNFPAGPREGERRPEGADRPREGERKPEGDRPREGDRRPEGADRPREGERKPEGDRPREGERRPEGADRPREGERKPEGDRPREGDRRPEGADRPREGERKPEGDRPREGERKPEGDRPREGDRRPEGADRPREGERRPEGDRPREGERRPEGADRPREGRPMEGRGPAFFRMLDKNQDGRLSKDELAKATDLFDELDRNHDGHLDPAELFAGTGGPPGPREGNPSGRDRGDAPREDAPRREGAPRGDAPRGDNPRGDAPRREAAPEGDRPAGDRRPDAERARGAAPIFQRLDRDGDGKISKDEAPEPMKERFSMLDTNGDGSVSLEEFRAGAQLLGDRVRGRQPEGREPEGRPEAPRRE